jgi:alkanesulfonate monooxygenase SsuD/methylene tetrahydromethanopterin reductase-like flavin-dependent oxidoreductase (luciferase family)
MLSVLALAEEKGFHSAWVMDNPLRGIQCLDPLVALSAASVVTERILLGTAVIISGLRIPALLAAELASIDRLSNGRLVVGVGLGSDPSLYEAYGMSSEHRVDRFASGIHLLRRMWQAEPVNYRDEFWSLSGVRSTPNPLQTSGPPLWFGGSDSRALERAVVLGEGWIGAGSSTLDEFAEHARFIRTLLDSAGARRTGFTIAKRLYVCLDAGGDALQKTRGWFERFYGDSTAADRYAYVGPEAGLQETVRFLERAGADLVILNTMFDHINQLNRVCDVLEARN